MGGLFGVVSRENCINDLFYGIDYHSHLGTTIGGLVVLSDRITKPICHEITNSHFKTEFKDDCEKLSGNFGIGIISSREEDKQPLVFRSKLGTFALCTDGLIKNADSLIGGMIEDGISFKEGSSKYNQTELVGELICTGSSITEGITKMYEKIHGTISLLLLSETERCIYTSSGVFPLVIGKKTTVKGNEFAVASETTAFSNLNYEIQTYPGYLDVISINELGTKIQMKSRERIVVCPFLHVYFDFPTSNHYGISGEIVRERCGDFLAQDDNIKSSLIMGVADSGIPHAHGYAKGKIRLAIKKSNETINQFAQGNINTDELRSNLNETLESIAPLRRPVIKFTAGWGRSYIPPQQSTRELVAYYKQVSNPHLIRDQSIVLVDDSIRRGTQLKRYLKEKIWPYKPKEIHARIGSPPQLFACYFDETTKNSDLIAWRTVVKIERGEPKDLTEYLDVSSTKYQMLNSLIQESIGTTSLKFISLNDLIKSVVEAPENTILKEEDLCTYCWSGKKPILNHSTSQAKLL
jgi:amidophosphoribosyltransferase